MVNKRDIAISVILSIVTCGIYGIYWFICLVDDMNRLAAQHGVEGTGQSGGLTFLLTLVTCGIYGLIWAFRVGEMLDKIKYTRGIPASNGGVLYLILFLLGGIIAYALIQNEINNLA